MFEKSLLTKLSDSVMVTHSQLGLQNADCPFGGLNVALFADFHQFPPVARTYAALYDSESSTDLGARGHNLYQQFKNVVLLNKQLRVMDPEWMGLLERLHSGICTADDVELLKTVTLDSPSCLPTSLDEMPWSNAIFITSCNAARNEWNAEALRCHCIRTGAVLYRSPAKDHKGKTHKELLMQERLHVAGMTEKKTGHVPDMLEIAIGMKCMVTINIATESDLANGTRGTIMDIILNPREPPPNPDEDNIVDLLYPPVLILFRPLNQENVLSFEGILSGLLPIVPSEVTFPVKHKKEKQYTVY
ncbi:uncharacterized protein ARMOST_14170 [Armillaria ostoyae]|uniref:DNA helicase n=1 Tax=Armillaria ostoyae TaxID=47428 RepID=A0A284RPS7_ARMOS|nr:uncharacterized protein ARMOST_14170 [Armillaria ostoyae]